MNLFSTYLKTKLLYLYCHNFGNFLWFQCKTELELVRLRVSSAMGAAWLAAKHVNYVLPRDDSAFCQVFFTYRPVNHISNGKENGTSVNHICENGTSKLNGTSHENGTSRENDASIGTSRSNGKLNGNHQNGETCGCGDWRNWSQCMLLSTIFYSL